ncbi:MAG TPA: 2-oxoacid:ferredoxin oxidoreductase subunit beta [Planctomycetota bacterium]|jgi:2-oxoglutarate ferredoxin oxidoreductase subunit beta
MAVAKVAEAPKTNKIGCTMDVYKGAESTLCAGCGHNAVTAQLIKALFDTGIQPHMVAKMSGIGCSSRTTAFFINQAHGFNGVHGRMAPVATGAALANGKLKIIGISGDGDTASIGMGHFVHTLRRNTDMLYILEDNGVYSLTKGQFSATADVGSKLKSGEVNRAQPIDCCALAIEMGCEFVACGFSGDQKQLHSLLKAALRHTGTALLDVVSPCVTFNNHEGSTKSYLHVKSQTVPLNVIDLVDPCCPPANAELADGEVREISMGDGAIVRLKKLSKDHDPTNRQAALAVLEQARRDKVVLTGLIYIGKSRPSLRQECEMVSEPLATLPTKEVRPSREALEQMMEIYG